MPITNAPHDRTTQQRLGTLRRELLDRTIICNQRRLDRLVVDYIDHYNTHRPHRSLDQRPPLGNEIRASLRPDLARPRFVRSTRCDGLINERAESLALQVEGWTEGPIAALHSAEDLAAASTELLQEATSDGHFRVMARVFTPAELAAPPEDRWKHSMPGAASNFGFRSVEVTDGTAVIVLNSLDYIKWSGATAVAAMEFARHAERVLIDVRGCRGGDPELIALLAGFFMGPSPVELSTVHWRDGAVETLWSDPDQAAFQFDPEVGLVVVVGAGTASGGEALADHLQAPGRALVVGQSTAGGAHRIKEFQLDGGLVARIPSGYVVNAFTGTDWEGQGVAPDVLVELGVDVIDIATKTATPSQNAR